jgi:predicted nucleotidyltransferase
MRKSYASTFVSYLLNSLNEPSNIKRIILFGSAARNEATKESDIDIFIETDKKDKKLEQKISKLANEFYTTREFLQFKINEIENKFHIIIGKLDEWKNLKESIESTGIILYGPYISSNIKGKKHIIVYWENIGKNRGAFLNKLYGFNIKDKKYPGLIETSNWKKLGKSSVLIPIEDKNKLFDLIKKYKVSAKIIEIYH